MRNIDVKKWQEDYKGNTCFLLAILEMLLAIPIIIVCSVFNGKDVVVYGRLVEYLTIGVLTVGYGVFVILYQVKLCRRSVKTKAEVTDRMIGRRNSYSKLEYDIAGEHHSAWVMHLYHRIEKTVWCDPADNKVVYCSSDWNNCFTVYIFMALGLACLAWGTPANC
ncbi:MAG: hypothetical protein II951_07885 [Bacteroidales bacterium]|nr:hypothetical protein [Bacteroidales bacterium]